MKKKSFKTLFILICLIITVSFYQGIIEADNIKEGQLEPFWRYSAALGPYLEQGQALIEIPDYLLNNSDFPYQKRDYNKEVPFADHLSIVRLLGGYRNEPERDLVYRDENGNLAYRMDLLKKRLDPYIENGYVNLTLVLDDIPYCFSEEIKIGNFGQIASPDDFDEWYQFIEKMCQELLELYGKEVANNFRFRVGTEMGSKKRFYGSQEEYFKYYDYAAAAITNVLPEAEVGLFNVSGASIMSMTVTNNVKAFDLAEHTLNEPNLKTAKKDIPFDFLPFSRYFDIKEDLEKRAKGLLDIRNAFENQFPEYDGISMEIHEFGIKPWGDESWAMEPGAQGAALTNYMLFSLDKYEIDRVWHWSFDSPIRYHGLKRMFNGIAWVYNILDHMAGGEKYFIKPNKSSSKTKNMLVGSLKEDEMIILISSHNKDFVEVEEKIEFSIAKDLIDISDKNIKYVTLNRDTDVHQIIRDDLEEEGLLNDVFVDNPERLGTLRDMGIGKHAGPAETYIAQNWDKYTSAWQKSLTLKKFTDEIGSYKKDDKEYTFTVKLSPPEVIALVIQ